MAKQKLGALWKRTTKAGKVLLSGVLEQDGTKTKVVIWPNDYKQRTNQPDFIIYLDDYDPATKAPAPAAGQAGDPFPTSADGEPMMPPDFPDDKNGHDDDIPF